MIIQGQQFEVYVFSDSSAGTVQLRGVTATLDADADVHALESGGAQQQKRLHHLEAELLGLHKLDRAAVDLDETMSALAVGDSNGGFLFQHSACSYTRIHSCVWTVSSFPKTR